MWDFSPPPFFARTSGILVTVTQKKKKILVCPSLWSHSLEHKSIYSSHYSFLTLLTRTDQQSSSTPKDQVIATTVSTVLLSQSKTPRSTHTHTQSCSFSSTNRQYLSFLLHSTKSTGHLLKPGAFVVSSLASCFLPMSLVLSPSHSQISTLFYLKDVSKLSLISATVVFRFLPQCLPNFSINWQLHKVVSRSL